MDQNNQTIVPTFTKVDAPQKIKEGIVKVLELRKSHDISIAKIYCETAKHLTSIKNDKDKHDNCLQEIILSGAMTKYELEDAKQLIKINGIESRV